MHTTPTERKILLLLSDGMPHTKQEVYSCLPDELGEYGNVRTHITNLRNKLRPRGEDIVCIVIQGRGYCYRHMRYLASASDGRV